MYMPSKWEILELLKVHSVYGTPVYRVYWEVPTKLVGNVPWVNLSQNNQTYLSPKLNSYGDKDKKFKESELLHHVEGMSGNPVTCCGRAPPHYS
jgi:hypothetical protein